MCPWNVWTRPRPTIGAGLIHGHVIQTIQDIMQELGRALRVAAFCHLRLLEAIERSQLRVKSLSGWIGYERVEGRSLGQVALRCLGNENYDQELKASAAWPERTSDAI